VRSLQVDSTKIVSCSIDKSVRVFDSATGTLMQTLRGHDDHVLALQFDLNRILSVSCDGVMRQWFWSGNKHESVPTADKLHVLGPGETLATLEKMYGAKPGQIARWNNLNDARMGKSLYTGMRLIVSKGQGPHRPGAPGGAASAADAAKDASEKGDAGETKGEGDKGEGDMGEGDKGSGKDSVAQTATPVPAKHE
jgi:hypothetical protein